MLPQSEFEAEQSDGIVARQASPFFLRQATKMIFNDLPRMWERHVEVWIIVGPHAVLLAPPREEARAHVIFEECTIDMFAEDFARLALDRHRAIVTEAVEVIIPLLE